MRADPSSSKPLPEWQTAAALVAVAAAAAAAGVGNLTGKHLN